MTLLDDYATKMFVKQYSSKNDREFFKNTPPNGGGSIEVNCEPEPLHLDCEGKPIKCN